MIARNRKRLGRIKRLGGILISLVALLTGVIGLWDISWPLPHLLALLAAVVGIIGLLLVDPAFNRRQRASYSAIATIVAVTIYFFAPAPAPWRGWLQAANDPTPHNLCDNPPTPRPDFPLPKNFITVILGDHAFGATKEFIEKANGRLVPFKACHTEPLSITFKHKEISVDGVISDSNGNIIGHIVNNGYEFPKTGPLLVEHSGDLSSLVVHDESGTELLFVRLLNEHAIRVRGVFSCGQGRTPIRVGDDGIFAKSGIRLGQGMTCFEDSLIDLGD